MTIERRMTVPELNEALEKQIAYTGELQVEIDRLRFEKAHYEADM